MILFAKCGIQSDNVILVLSAFAAPIETAKIECAQSLIDRCRANEPEAGYSVHERGQSSAHGRRRIERNQPVKGVLRGHFARQHSTLFNGATVRKRFRRT